MNLDSGAKRIIRNMIANLAGNGVLAVMQVLLVPVFIRSLGIRAYGFFGFYLGLQAMAQVFDLGLGTTLNREMARYSVEPEKSDEARALARTLEISGWMVALVAGGIMLGVVAWLAGRWGRDESIGEREISLAVFCVGMLVSLQLLVRFYQGGLMGLQRQPRMNAIQIVMITLRDGGAIAILLWVSPTLSAFFTWQVAVMAIYVVALRAGFWKSMPEAPGRGWIDFRLLASRSGFAAGMSGVTLLWIVITQIDKVILSRLLDLDDFGHYVLATTVATGLTLITISLYNALFPHFSTLLAAGDEASLLESYRFNSQAMALMVMPAVGMLWNYASDLLYFWTGDRGSSTSSGPVLSIYVTGTAINSLMLIPTALQLASGWTALAIRICVMQVVLFVPGLILLSISHGPRGAAAAWACSCGLNLAAGTWFTHRRFLKNVAVQAFVGDTLLPAVAVSAGALAWRLAVAGRLTGIPPVASAIALWILLTAAAAMTAGRLRRKLSGG